MKIELWPEGCWHAHFTRHLQLLLTIVKQYLQEPRTAEHGDRKVSYGKEIKEDLTNPAELQPVRMDCQRVAENLANLLSSELAKRLVHTSQEPTLFQCKPLPLNVESHFFMTSFAAGTPTVIVNSIKNFKETWRWLELASKAGVSDSTTKKTAHCGYFAWFSLQLRSK